MTLDLQDLGPQDGGEAGVRVWREPRPGAREEGGKGLAWSLAWHDLAILDVRLEPRTSWPAGCHPERQDGWGEVPTRIVWVPGLGRYVYQTRTTVPTIADALALKPGDGARAFLTGGTFSGLGYPARLLAVTAGGSPVYWSEETRGRLERALGTSIDRLVLKRVYPSWAPACPIVVVWYSGRIRGICSVREASGG